MISKRISWSISFPPEVMTEYTGTKLRDFYERPEVKMEVQLESSKLFSQLYGIPESKVVYASGGLSYIAASVLGANVEYPEDDAPQVRGRRLEDISQVHELMVGDISGSGVMKQILSHYEYMKERARNTDVRAELGIGGQGPFTTAVILRGGDMFTDIIENPEESKLLLEKCVEANLAVLGLVEEISGKKLDAIGIGDDYGGMLSPALYEEFALPYLLKLFSYNEGAKKFLHCETLRKDHLKYLDIMGIDSYDPGVNDMLKVDDLVKGTKCGFTYNLFTVRDMLYGTPDTIREKYAEIVKAGAPAVFTEICRKTPRENIKAYVDIAREFE